MAYETIILDVDTQKDFILPEGAWPVPGASGLIPSFERICRYARMYNLRVIATTQVLSGNDPRFEPNGGDAPPHCLAGTPGVEKVRASRPDQPVTLENRSYPAGEVERLTSAAREIVLQVSGADPMNHPAMPALLNGVRNVIVFGVAADGAVRRAVEFLLGRGLAVEVVETAVQARSTEADATEEALEELVALGVRRIRDLDIMTRYTTSRHR